MGRSFEIHIRNIKDHRNIKVADFIGEIDITNSLKLKSLIDLIIEDNNTCIIGDLRRLRFIDSTGILNLISISVKARKYGASFKLFGVSDNLKTIFDDTGLARIITLYDNFENAFASVLSEIKDKNSKGKVGGVRDVEDEREWKKKWI